MSAQPNQVSVRMAVVRTQWEATPADVTKDSSLTPHRLNVLVRTLFAVYISLLSLHIFEFSVSFIQICCVLTSSLIRLTPVCSEGTS